MQKERNKADSYREKAYESDTKAMNRSSSARLLPKGRKNLELAFEWYMKAADKEHGYKWY